MAAADLREVVLNAAERLDAALNDGDNLGREGRLKTAAAFADGVLLAVAAYLEPDVAVLPPDRGHRSFAGGRVVAEDVPR